MSATGASPDLDRIGRHALPEVIEAFLGWSVTELPPTPVDLTRAAEDRLLAVVQLQGPQVAGVVQLELPPTFAAQAAVRLVGGGHRPPSGHVEAGDFAGELTNLLAGRVAARLRLEGYPCALSNPEVALGGQSALESLQDPRPTPARSTAQGRTVWSCQGHRLTLEIRLDHPPT